MRTILMLLVLGAVATAEEGVRTVPFLNYPDCVELSNASTRVIVGHHSGGRVLKYEREGKEVLYLDPREAQWGTAEGKGKSFTSAGRFDIGPEYLIPEHPVLWSGEWEVVGTGSRSVTIRSQPDAATGVQLTRRFALAADSPHLACVQTIANISERTVRWCHWSRTFAKGGGIVVVPIGENPRRLPKGYVMYPERHLINLQPEDAMIRRRGAFLEILGAPAFPKLGMDARGWLAYQLRDDVAFVKVYETPADRAYNEVAAFNTSVWYPDQGKIAAVELEPIGPANEIAPGESADFAEHWFIVGNEYPKEGAELDLEALAEKIKRECVIK